MNALKWLLFIVMAIAFLGFAAFIFATVFLVKKVSEPKSKEFLHAERTKINEQVAERKKSLHPWAGHGYADISNRMNYRYTKMMEHRLRGKIFSTQGKPIIAFERLERGLMKTTGHIYASSTDFDLYYDIRSHDSFVIHYDGLLLGGIRTNGDIVNPQGKIIGKAQHPPQAAYSSSAVYEAGKKEHYLFMMNGRLLATIKVAMDLEGRSLSEKVAAFVEGSSKVLEVHDSPNAEEEKWLLAMAILETTFYSYALL